MAQSPAAAQRVRLDASAESKCLLEATSRTPAVLDALGIPYKLAQPMFGLIKPVFAHLADIGAAALKMLLGTVTYLGQGDRWQVDVTHWRLPDRTPQPTAPTADGLANEVTTVIRDTIAGVLAVHQRAAAATTAGGEAWQAAHAAWRVATRPLARVAPGIGMPREYFSRTRCQMQPNANIIHNGAGIRISHVRAQCDSPYFFLGITLLI